jgi:hypothetical protein
MQVELLVVANHNSLNLTTEYHNISIYETPTGIEFASNDPEVVKDLNAKLSNYLNTKVFMTIKHDNGPRKRLSGFVVLGKTPDQAPKITFKITGESQMQTEEPKQQPAPEAAPSSTPESAPSSAQENVPETATPTEPATTQDAGDGTTPPFSGGGSEGGW